MAEGQEQGEEEGKQDEEEEVGERERDPRLRESSGEEEEVAVGAGCRLSSWAVAAVCRRSLPVPVPAEVGGNQLEEVVEEGDVERGERREGELKGECLAEEVAGSVVSEGRRLLRSAWGVEVGTSLPMGLGLGVEEDQK